MPPAARFTKAQIADAALEIVRENGREGLTTRALAKRLGSSSCPIFTVFENMEEVQQAAIEAAKNRYKEYVERGLADTPAFKGVGQQYILFAIQEPRLFRLLFMSEQPAIPDLDGVLPLIDESYEKILASITDGYGIARPDAMRLYRHLWIYSHGIAVLCATKMCRFTGEEISRMITEIFVSLLKEIRRND